jgi:hypothetical protein
MKIEIKPFDDRARYTQPIIFMRLDKRPNAVKQVPRFFAPDVHRKILARRIF